MLWMLDTSTLLMMIAAVGVASLVLGFVLDAILGEDGFGPVGNATLAGAGFFFGIHAADEYGFVVRDFPMATAIGLAGAFSGVAALAMLKGVFNRL